MLQNRLKQANFKVSFAVVHTLIINACAYFE